MRAKGVMTLRLRRSRASRLLAAAGVAGLFAMHGFGPSHDLMEVVHTTSATMSHSPAAATQAPTSGQHDGPTSASEAPAAPLATVATTTASTLASAASVAWRVVTGSIATHFYQATVMPGACIAVLAARVVLLALARLRAATRLISLVPPPPATAAGGLARASPARDWRLNSPAHLCIWRI